MNKFELVLFDSSRRGRAVPLSNGASTPLSPVPRPHYRQCGCVHYFGHEPDVVCDAHVTQHATHWGDVLAGVAIGILIVAAMMLAGFGELPK